MSPALEQFAMTLARMCVFGPVVFLGLMMAMDPSRFVSLLNDLTQGVQRFNRHLQARWQEPFWSADPLPHSRRVETALRLAGVVIVALGLLGLAEILG